MTTHQYGEYSFALSTSLND